MDFAAFLLLNVVLFIRPMEFIPGLYGIPLYNIAFCLCALLSLPVLLSKGTVSAIAGHPVGLCVITVAFTGVLSNLIHGGLADAALTLDALIKVVLYYFLLVVVVRSPVRLKWFLASLVIDGCIVAALGVADYKGYFKVPGLVMIEEVRIVDGESFPFRRLCSTGIFSDPNDFGLFLAGCLTYSLYLAMDRSGSLLFRAFWILLPVPILLQALLLTYSRAGMLTLLIAIGISAVARWGKRTVLALLPALPLVLRMGGRQLDFSLSAGTGQARVAIWDIYVGLFTQNPLLGVGYDHCLDYAIQVAHNSYIHAFVELGFLGGTAFLGTFLMGLIALMRFRTLRHGRFDPRLARIWPFILAGVGSYAIGIISLSRCYVIPTYTTLGLVVAFERMALAGSRCEPMRFEPKFMVLLLATSLAFLMATFILVKRTANYY